MNAPWLYLLTSVIYAGLAVRLWNNCWRAEPGAETRAGSFEHGAMLVALILHGALLGSSLFGGAAPDLRVGNAVSSIVWLTAVIYWLAGLRAPVESVQTMVLGAAAVAVWVPLLAPAHHVPQFTALPVFRAHLAVAILAYSLFTIAAFQAILMAIVERRLHSPAGTPLGCGLPPLLTLETILFRVIATGFALLTLTLVSGIVFSEEVFGKPMSFSHKTVFGWLSWAVFGGLLLGRRVRGWRGRMAIRWTLAGFVMLLLAYVGSKFVLEVILHRG
jgi:ABC-type uncharacterized transport system permease subunit